MNQIEFTERHKAIETILYSATAIIFSILCFVVSINLLNIGEDDALHLTSAFRIVNGEQPYVDFMDTNPPVMMYLNIIPVLFSYVLRIHPITSFLLFVVLVTVLSLALVRRIVFKSELNIDRVVFALIVTLLASLQLYFFTNYPRLYGQREHFFFFMYLPFFAIRWVRWEGGYVDRNITIVAGIVAGIATAIKPHFIPLALAPEIYWLLAKRSYRKLFTREIYAYVSVGLVVSVYLLSLYAFDVGMFREWLSTVPRMYKVMYHAPLIELYRKNHYIVAFLALSMLSFIAGKRTRTVFSPELRPLSVFLFVAVIMYVLQQKGFQYHFMPALYAATILLTIYIWRSLEEIPPKINWDGFAFLLLVYSITKISLKERDRQIWFAVIVAVAIAIFFRKQIIAAFSRKLAKTYVTAAVIVVLLGSGYNLYSKSVLDRALAQKIERYNLMEAIEKYSEPNDGVMHVGLLLNRWLPQVLQMGRILVTPYMDMYPLHYAANMGAREGISEEENYRNYEEIIRTNTHYHEIMESAIRNKKPRLILVWASTEYGLSSLKYMETSGLMDVVRESYDRVPETYTSWGGAEIAVFVRRDM